MSMIYRFFFPVIGCTHTIQNISISENNEVIRVIYDQQNENAVRTSHERSPIFEIEDTDKLSMTVKQIN